MSPSSDRTSNPTTIAVLGSCITRDNFNSRFNPDYRRWFSCELLQNQSSLISVMAEPIEAVWEPLKKFNDEGTRRIDSEFNKRFLTDLVALQPAYLIIDLFGDVRFGVLQVDDGSYLTNNAWTVWFTTWYREMKAAGRLRRISPYRDTEEYLALWRDAAQRLAVFVRANLPQTKVIVHRGHNTNLLQLPDRAQPVSLRKNRSVHRLPLKRSNEWWKQLDEELAALLDAQIIDLTDRTWPTYDDHAWGASLVHYIPDYYPMFLAELQRIQLADRLGADDAALLDQVVSAFRTSGAREREHHRKVVEEQRVTNRRLRKKLKRARQREAPRSQGLRPRLGRIKRAVLQRLSARRRDQSRAVLGGAP